jgi:inhibitor of cysteine peptidase
MILVASDSGRTLELSLNETLEIELSENPTTGYRWQISQNGAPVLELAGDTFQLGSSSGIGGGGTRKLEFHSNVAGATTLRIVYGRPGVKDSIKQEFTLNLHVATN